MYISKNQENLMMFSNKFISEREYWMDKLAGITEIAEFPVDSYRKSSIGQDKKDIDFLLPQDLANKIIEISNGSEIGIYMLFISSIMALLYKYSMRNDIIVGTSPIYNEEVADVKLTNCILPIRCNIDNEISFKDLLLNNVNPIIYDANKYKNIPLNKIVQILYKDQIMLEGNSLTKTMVLMQNMQNNINIYDSSVDICFYFNLLGKNIECKIVFNALLYRTDTICGIFEHLMNFQYNALFKSDKSIKDIDVLSEKERNMLLYEFNDTFTVYPCDKTVQQLFEDQVEKTPNNIALVFGNQNLTYKELNEKANKVAWFIQKKGIPVDSIIGIMVERSFDMIIGILGILKAGCTYLPIDPDYPQDRIKYLLHNSQASSLLVQKEILIETIPNINMYVIDEIYTNNDLLITNPELPYITERLMYILYTSGSTGQPKGVMIKNHAFVNLINWFNRKFHIDERDSILLIAPVSFDLAQKNIFSILIKGGKLCLFPSGIYDYNLMSEIIHKHMITIINCTPSAFYPLIDLNEKSDYIRLTTLTRVFLGGEPINIGKINLWAKSNNCSGNIINTYGPTECTDIASFYCIDDNLKSLNSVPIGKPIDNVNIYILDNEMNLLPVGVPGELYIGGSGLAKGYYNLPELTQEKFVVTSLMPNKKIYKTGDLAKWLPSGDIEFLGRIDNQVKIRGFRIELEEIETCLLKYEQIKEAVVIDKVDKAGNKYLCAYVVLKCDIMIHELRKFISGKLPQYMVPSYFILMDAIPLTPNGKIDRKSLPEPDDKDIYGTDYIAPRNKTEMKLVEIWEKLLNGKHIGIDNNFFELGGHSIKAVSLAAKIQEKFNIDIPLNEFFKDPNIKFLSKYIINQNNTCSNSANKSKAILLRKGNNETNNIFLIHPGSGEIGLYIDFSSFIDTKFNVWGLNSYKYGEENVETSIEVIANKYILDIQEVQPAGPYNIAGLCIGGTIAYEIARQLEKDNEKVSFIGLINTYPPHDSLVYDHLKVVTKELLAYTDFNIINNKFVKVDDIYKITIDYIKNSKCSYDEVIKAIPKYIYDEIPNCSKCVNNLLIYLNILRTLNNARAKYVPLTKLNAQINFFESNNAIVKNKLIWNNYSAWPIKVITVDGGHTTIFNNPFLFSFSETFNKYLSVNINPDSFG